MVFCDLLLAEIGTAAVLPNTGSPVRDNSLQNNNTHSPKLQFVFESTFPICVVFMLTETKINKKTNKSKTESKEKAKKK